MLGRRSRKWAIGLVIVVAVPIAIGLLFDWNWFKPLVEERVSASLHRRVTIDNLHVALWPHPLYPQITVDGVTIPNPPGFPADSRFGEIQRIAVTVDLRKLLNRTVRITDLEIDGPHARLLRNDRGVRNWDFTDPDEKVHVAPTNALPEIGRLVIRDGNIRMVDAKLGADLTLKLRTSGEAGKTPEIIADGNGRYNNQPFALVFRGASVLSLRDQATPYQFYLKSQVGRSVSILKGDVTRPLGDAGYKADLQLSGPSLSELFPIIGVPSPPTPPYDLKGSLEYQGADFRFTNFRGRVGDSDLEGNLTFKAGDRRQMIEADLRSDKVVLADLKGFIGALPGRPQDTPEAKAAEAANSKADVVPNDAGGTKPVSRSGAPPVAKPPVEHQPFVTRPGKILPDMTINLPQFRAVDAAVKYRGRRVISEDLPLDDLALDMTLKNGRMAIRPLKFGIGKGQIALNIDLDGQRDPVGVTAQVDFRQIDLHRIMRQTKRFEGLGEIGGKAELKTTGNSVAQMLGRGNGDLKLFMSGGSLSGLLVDLAELDIPQSLGLVVTDPKKQFGIRCMVADMPMQDGIMKAKTFILDTTADRITVEGEINFRDETLNLVLIPHPKKPSVGTLRAPIDITGTFEKPSVLPDPKVVGARTGAAAVLGVVLTPLGALIPTIELGLGKDSNCTDLLNQAKAPQPQTSRR